MSRRRALVVDDEPDIRELICMTLDRMDVDAVPAENLDAAYALVKERRLDLCLTDMRLPDGSGIDLVEFISRHSPSVPVAVITAHGNMDSAVSALKAGAFDFVSKPIDLPVLRGLVRTALSLGEERTATKRPLIGNSELMRGVRDTIAKLARSQAPVYVSGESGTGKELVARMIHELGPRSTLPFVPVNCGAIPNELMESELFGHKKGSFTGATTDNPGLFKAAHGGTLFLDEVGDLPLSMQVKLLRAIQEKLVRPIGSQEEIAVDVRIISASHRDLDALVGSERFRQDLYYRLNVINLHVPPLRDRPGDIGELAEHIIAKLTAGAGSEPPKLEAGALAALGAYSFPGNVRELENMLERALALSEDGRIGAAELGLTGAAKTGAVGDGLNQSAAARLSLDAEGLGKSLSRPESGAEAGVGSLAGSGFGPGSGEGARSGPGSGPGSGNHSEVIAELRVDDEFSAGHGNRGAGGLTADGGDEVKSMTGGAQDLQSVLEEVEKRTIIEALERVRWNKTAAAKRLGISFGALRYRMQKLGLD